MSWLKKVLHFFTPLSSAELPNSFKERVETVNETYKKVPKKRGRPRKKK